MTHIATATKFFLPMYEGDHSAFQPYAMGEVAPAAADMDGFITVTLDSAANFFEPQDGDAAHDLREELLEVQTSYCGDSAFAAELQAWCLAQATAAAAS
jgi:hypothetical protein